MSGFTQMGIIPLIPKNSDVNNTNSTSRNFETNQYPFRKPEIYLEGLNYIDSKFPIFAQAKDSVVMVRPTFLMKYTYHHFVEQLIEDKEGNVSWRPVQELEAEEWPGKFLGKTQGNHKLEIAEYDFATMEKKLYKVDLASVTPIKPHDYEDLVNYVDPELIDKPASEIFYISGKT